MPIIITKITDKVDKMEDQIPKVVPAINIDAIVIKNGNLPIARNKIISDYGNQSFSWRIYNSCTNNTSCITSKPHAHGSNNMVVLKSTDKCGRIQNVNIKINVYFRV